MSKATNDLTTACNAVMLGQRHLENRLSAAAILLRLLDTALLEMATSRSHRCSDRINALLPYIEGRVPTYDARELESQP